MVCNVACSLLATLLIQVAQLHKTIRAVFFRLEERELLCRQAAGRLYTAKMQWIAHSIERADASAGFAQTQCVKKRCPAIQTLLLAPAAAPYRDTHVTLGSIKQHWVPSELCQSHCNALQPTRTFCRTCKDKKTAPATLQTSCRAGVTLMSSSSVCRSKPSRYRRGNARARLYQLSLRDESVAMICSVLLPSNGLLIGPSAFMKPAGASIMRVS